MLIPVPGTQWNSIPPYLSLTPYIITWYDTAQNLVIRHHTSSNRDQVAPTNRDQINKWCQLTRSLAGKLNINSDREINQPSSHYFYYHQFTSNYNNCHFKMGSCVSTNGEPRRSSSKAILTKRSKSCSPTYTRNKNTRKITRKNQKNTTPLSKNNPRFIYIPSEELPELSEKFQRTDPVPMRTSTAATHVSRADFCRIYRNSDIVDKKLFLNSGFIVDELFSPTPASATESLDLISPIIPDTDQFHKVVEGTFLLSPDLILSPEILASTARIPSEVNGRTTGWGKQQQKQRRNTATLESQRTTYISDDASTMRDVFSFDEEAIEALQNIYSSSFKSDHLELFCWINRIYCVYIDN